VRGPAKYELAGPHYGLAAPLQRLLAGSCVSLPVTSPEDPVSVPVARLCLSAEVAFGAVPVIR